MQSFKNLHVWEKAHKLTVDVYKKQHEVSFTRDLWLDVSDATVRGIDRGQHC
jgi:hypothetical protein